MRGVGWPGESQARLSLAPHFSARRRAATTHPPKWGAACRRRMPVMDHGRDRATGGFCLGHHPHPQSTIIPCPSHTRGEAFAGASDRYLLMSPPPGSSSQGEDASPQQVEVDATQLLVNCWAIFAGVGGCVTWVSLDATPDVLPFSVLGHGHRLCVRHRSASWGDPLCRGCVFCEFHRHVRHRGVGSGRWLTGPCAPLLRAVIR